MREEAERRVGTVISGKWRVDSLLDSGSMASVYAVTHRNGARAALKMLHPALCADKAVCGRFLGEAYLTNSVKHPGIVRVFDDGMTGDGCVFLVMDLLEGRTLEALRLVRGGQIGVREALDIADKLMDVLHAVHEAELVHRDLKPQNVFICDDGSVKLLDFGIARVRDQAAQSKVSMFGLVLGTPSFMSPEQALGQRENVDQRSDIWSLGATLFTSITGQTVHLGPTLQSKMRSVATTEPRSISMARPDLPASVVAAIDSALRFKQEERWQTVAAFRRALCEAGLQLGAALPDAIAADPVEILGAVPDGSSPAAGSAFRRPYFSDVEGERRHPVRRSGRRLWLAALAAAVAVVGGVTFVSVSPIERSPRTVSAASTSTLAVASSAVPATFLTPAPTPAEQTPVDVRDSAMDASAKTAALATTLPPTRTTHMAISVPRSGHPPARSAPRPTVTSEPPPADPFGTPE
jgi:serine/threonine protein kinase